MNFFLSGSSTQIAKIVCEILHSFVGLDSKFYQEWIFSKTLDISEKCQIVIPMKSKMNTSYTLYISEKWPIRPFFDLLGFFQTQFWHFYAFAEIRNAQNNLTIWATDLLNYLSYRPEKPTKI